MIQALYDIRFAFDTDNPFEHDSTKTCLNKLKKYLAEHADEYTVIDYLNNSKYLMVCPNVKTIFGEEVDETFTSNKLNDEIKKFIRENITKLPSTLSKWVNEKASSSSTSPSLTTSSPSTSLSGGNNSSKTNEFDAAFDDITSNMIAPPMNTKFSSALSIGLHYDISNDKAITYDDVCKLCMNIARTKLVESNAVTDPTVAALEREKRKKLTYEINRYRSNALITTLVEEDISQMSLEQLESCLEQCKRLQENFKVLEVCKRSFSASGTIYSALFPEGIPVGKNKRVCFKGMGKEVLNTLFNSTTTTGIAFQNILDKNNIHISDELLTMIAFGEICLSKVEIKTVEPEKEKEDVSVEQLNAINDVVNSNRNYASQELENIDEYDEYDE